MGSPVSEKGRNDDEGPQHRVTVQSFYMSKYEVTQAQWQAVMGANPSRFIGDNLPVEQVSWNDARVFIQRLNRRQSRYSYRLPTEAEWEYACRAGTTGPYAGNLDAMAWYVDNSDNKTHPVGEKQSNAWNLYDMHGNVWEWVEDVLHENYNDAPSDGSAWLSSGDSRNRVVRGGSWSTYGGAYGGLRSADHWRYAPDTRLTDLGFRLVSVARIQ